MDILYQGYGTGFPGGPRLRDTFCGPGPPGLQQAPSTWAEVIPGKELGSVWAPPSYCFTQTFTANASFNDPI